MIEAVDSQEAVALNAAVERQGLPAWLLTALPIVALGVIVLLAVGLRLERAWEPAETLVYDSTYDDAYYYFGIARHIADGDGVTFDGENVTNGFHPLWLAAITPFFLVTDDLDLPVALSLTLATLLRGVTIVLLWVIVRRLTSNAWAGLIPALYYAMHPYIIGETLNGVETSLVTLTLAAALLVYLGIARRTGEAPLSDYVWLGVAGGFLILSRTDMGVIFACMVAYTLFVARCGPWLAAALRIGGASLVVTLPWIAWNLYEFGTIVQVSGLASGEIGRQGWELQNDGGFWSRAGEGWERTRLFFRLIPEWFVVPRGWSVRVFTVVCAGVAVLMLVAPLRQAAEFRRQMLWLAPVIVGIVAVLLFHSAYRWHVREWYYGPAGLMIALMMGLVVAYAHGAVRDLGERMRLQARSGDVMVAALYGVVLAGMVWAYAPWDHRWEDIHDYQRRPQQNMLAGARWLNANTPPDARIASFNAGIFGYYSERTVINLDGLVNEDAYHALEDCTMAQYIIDQRIEYFIDLEPVYVLAGCGNDGSMRLQRIARVGEDFPFPGGPRVDVYRVVVTPGGS